MKNMCICKMDGRIFTRIVRAVLYLHTILLICVLLPVSSITKRGNDGRTTVVVNKPSRVPSYIVISHPPVYIRAATNLSVEFVCSDKQIIGVDIVLLSTRRKTRLLSRKTWDCVSSQKKTTQTIVLNLKGRHLYQPVLLETYNPSSDTPEIRVWVMTQSLWKSLRQNDSSAYKAAQAKESHECLFVPAHLRPLHPDVCLKWGEIVKRETMPIRLFYGICKKESETIIVLDHPAVISGKHYGVTRAFEPYHSPFLEESRVKRLANPLFTITMWLFIDTYCDRELCSILQHYNRTNYILTPAIFITKQGTLHIQISLEDGTSYANLTPFNLPSHEWVLLVFSYKSTKWTLSLHYGPLLRTTQHTSFIYTKHVYDSVGHTTLLPLPYMNDTDGLFVFGGSPLFAGFKGFVADARFYRRHHFTKKELREDHWFVTHESLSDLGLAELTEKCNVLKSRIAFIVYQCKLIRERRINARSCSNRFLDLIPKAKLNETQKSLQCSIYYLYRGEKYKIITDFIKRTVLKSQLLKYEAIANVLYARATSLIDTDLNSLSAAIKLFRQASCLGNNDASYALAVIYNNGVRNKVDNHKAYTYLALSILNQHKLASMALASRFFYAQDGHPHDVEHAYMYYKYVCDQTVVDKEAHKDTDVHVESVRLTDDLIVEQQMDEDGDIFRWLQHQAKKGVIQAQQHTARSLYWGSQGVARNLEKAAEYYKMSAESEDPAALFDYGIILLRGHGVERDVNKALEYLTKSAKRGHAPALTALGWYALHHAHNYTEAVLYFEKGVYAGNKEAGANLAHMILTGKHPKYSPTNEQKIFELYYWSATRGQVDAAIMVAFYYMRGTEVTKRHPLMAAEWARFVAEQNPAVGAVLRKAFKHFKNGQYDTAMFYYLLAADAGIEVASFNVALMCDTNLNNIKEQMDSDCVWRQFNYTIHRDPRTVDSYSWIKMADYYWYGCGGTKNATRAAQYYSNAIRKGDPQALFNLAFMVEEGVTLPDSVWRSVSIPHSIYSDRLSLLNALYSRCITSKNSEAFVPCTIAQLKLNFMNIWDKYQFFMLTFRSLSCGLQTTVYTNMQDDANGQTYWLWSEYETSNWIYFFKHRR